MIINLKDIYANDALNNMQVDSKCLLQRYKSSSKLSQDNIFSDNTNVTLIIYSNYTHHIYK